MAPPAPNRSIDPGSRSRCSLGRDDSGSKSGSRATPTLLVEAVVPVGQRPGRLVAGPGPGGEEFAQKARPPPRRSEERRVGKEGVRQSIARWSRFPHKKKK